MRPRILDLYCGAGGASKGYEDAGFEVVGVDIAPQPHYPFRFVQQDAVRFLRMLRMQTRNIWGFDAVHASPPCQAFTHAQRIRQNEHPDLIGPTRDLLEEIGLPYVIENVPGAPLKDPITLCGAMFGLRTYRHREFECSFPAKAPLHPDHTAKQTKMGRPPKPGEFMHIVGHFAGVKEAREIMEIDWMTRNELKEAIPPAYTRWIGGRLMEYLDGAKEHDTARVAVEAAPKDGL